MKQLESSNVMRLIHSLYVDTTKSNGHIHKFPIQDRKESCPSLLLSASRTRVGARRCCTEPHTSSAGARSCSASAAPPPRTLPAAAAAALRRTARAPPPPAPRRRRPRGAPRAGRAGATLGSAGASFQTSTNFLTSRPRRELICRDIFTSPSLTYEISRRHRCKLRRKPWNTSPKRTFVRNFP